MGVFHEVPETTTYNELIKSNHWVLENISLVEARIVRKGHSLDILQVQFIPIYSWTAETYTQLCASE